MREGMYVRTRNPDMGIGTVIAVIRDEGLEVIRVQWKYEYGIREHLRKDLSIFVPAGDEHAHSGRRYGNGY